jgi:hypothetical protein
LSLLLRLLAVSLVPCLPHITDLQVQPLWAHRQRG